jgi:ABC-type uncharacterized transport system ATPase subunit
MDLRIRGLAKTYPNGVHALRDVTLTIPRGMFGLLGPQRRRQVDAHAHARHAAAARRGTVTLGDSTCSRARPRAPDARLPAAGVRRAPAGHARSCCTHFAVLKGITDRGERRTAVERLLRQVNLWDARRKRLGGYSGGMRQRFGVAVALLATPRCSSSTSRPPASTRPSACASSTC